MGSGGPPSFRATCTPRRFPTPAPNADDLPHRPAGPRRGRAYGPAILSTVEAARRRIYTARFIHTVKGQQRGAFEWALEEVGTGPVEALDELLALVPRRSEEEEPPASVSPASWFAAEPPAA